MVIKERALEWLRFFRFGVVDFKKLVEAEKFAVEGATVGEPFGFAGVDGWGGAGKPELHRNPSRSPWAGVTGAASI